MSEQSEAATLETLRTLARRAGLDLSEADLAKYGPAYELIRAETDALRERDLGVVEPAVTFRPGA